MDQQAEAPSERRYCEDCRFCRVSDTGISFARCGSPKAPATSGGERFVAREFDRPSFASTMRLDGNRCGPDAAWFESKPSIVEAA